MCYKIFSKVCQQGFYREKKYNYHIEILKMAPAPTPSFKLPV